MLLALVLVASVTAEPRYARPGGEMKGCVLTKHSTTLLEDKGRVGVLEEGF